MSARDGGAAFPFPDSQGPAPGALLGMSLRDYFAAQALSPLVAEALRLDHRSWAATVQHAYFVADAMLTERAKEPQP